MEKREYIKSLEQVKIVLGNGFDLHCGLHTTYSDFFKFYFKKSAYINWLYKYYTDNGQVAFDFTDPNMKNINTWDIFFVLNDAGIKYEGSEWCDIERLIHSSLIPYNEYSKADVISRAMRSSINWNKINSYIFGDIIADNHLDRFVVEFVKSRAEFLNQTLNNFYGFLLSELKIFEMNFGQFIFRQTHNRHLESFNYGSIFLNNNYLNDAAFTLGELCDENNIVAIDSFNYSIIEKSPYKEKLHNINGFYENPIFGIDTEFLPSDERYIFTKTSRRIDFDMSDDFYDSKVDFKNVIIYGHSLNQADYSYFFPLFDKLDLLNSIASGVLVFAYTIYDEAKESKIKSALRLSISKIIFEYAKSKGVSDPERLLDKMSTQRRIILYHINPINRLGRYKSHFDDEWEKIDHEIEIFNETHKDSGK